MTIPIGIPAGWPERPTDDLIHILGRPNFTCGVLARALRLGAKWDIPQKAEAEQAAVLFWMLTHWLRCGEGWHDAAAVELDKWAAERKDSE
jgi:hypothetical protein